MTTTNKLGDDWTVLTPLETAVGESIGAASVAWTEVPTGIFNDTWAKEIGDQLVNFIEGKIEEAKADAYADGLEVGYDNAIDTTY